MAYTPQIYYPNNYQYQMPQQQQMPVPQQNQSNNGLIWVTGEIGAKSYLVAPNQSVLLMDSEGDKFYLKTTDSAGMPSLRTFEYKEVSQNSAQCSNSAFNQVDEQFVTREEYKAICGKYEELKHMIEDIQKPKTTRKKEGLFDE